MIDVSAVCVFVCMCVRESVLARACVRVYVCVCGVCVCVREYVYVCV